jgi:hypothetical protein
MFVRDTVENVSYGVVFIPSLMAIDSGIQVILRLLAQKIVGGFNVGITDGSDLLSMPL